MRSPHTSYRWRGERVIEPIKCMRSPHSYRWRGESHRANQVDALTTHQLQVERERVIDQSSDAHHTPATGGEERVIEPIKDALTTHQLQVERRETHQATGGEEREVIEPNQVYALTTHQLQVERKESHRGQSSGCAHQTPATAGEERERHRPNQVYALTTHQLQVERKERDIEPIKWMRSPQSSYRWRGQRES